MSSVPRLFPNSTITCLGGGPSLTAEDVAACRGKVRVIAINDAYRLAPWADVLYGCDEKWWAWHRGVPSFTGPKFGLESGARKWGVTVLQKTGADGLERDPSGLRHGRNSGYQAINLAVHLGAQRILLLGYDMRLGTKAHWFGDHPNGAKPPVATFLPFFDRLAPELARLGVTVLNCSRTTALQAFPRMALADALAAEAVSA